VGAFLGEGLSLAACNAPSLCVVSGRTPLVEALKERLAALKIGALLLHTSHAFHSEMMDPILAPFTQKVAGARRERPAIPYISSATGAWITEEEATDPGYWAMQLRRTVRFSQGIRELQKVPGRILLEVGPGTTLSTLALQHADPAARQTVLSSLGHASQRGPDLKRVLEVLGGLWRAGMDVDFALVHAHERRRRTPLPTYPFERKRFWIDIATEEALPAPRPGGGGFAIPDSSAPGGMLDRLVRMQLQIMALQIELATEAESSMGGAGAADPVRT